MEHSGQKDRRSEIKKLKRADKERIEDCEEADEYFYEEQYYSSRNYNIYMIDYGVVLIMSLKDYDCRSDDNTKPVTVEKEGAIAAVPADVEVALRLEGLSVTNPKGLNAEASLSSDSPFSVELALTVTLRVVDILLLQQYVVEEMARLRVGENMAEKAIVVGFVISGRAPPWQVTLPEVVSAKLEGVGNCRWWKDQIWNIIVSHNLEHASEKDRKNDIRSGTMNEYMAASDVRFQIKKIKKTGAKYLEIIEDSEAGEPLSEE
ncbi:hypothetical protein VNO80_00101 [Phaseolus coccineus]|uniref:Uncharacterized protein n=1 Tax=Phaseolus coccineus TaxID=3886 RepID=A0AAN9NYT8_PHACN